MSDVELTSRAARVYLPIRVKFFIALIGAFAWTGFSIKVAQPWQTDLSAVIGPALAFFVVYGVAIIPGFMNSFMVMSLVLDKRPQHKTLAVYPPITVLIAAYNEEKSIKDTLLSIERQNYPGELQVIVINDGSQDRTADIVRELQQEYAWLSLVDLKQNGRKANALNQGLKFAEHELVLTVDADSYLYHNAMQSIVERYKQDPPNTRAVAGTILVRNSRESWLTRSQEWDYFHGIAAIKRMQSLCQGTLVAQGAFSLHDKQTLLEVGGWPECVGEDIVLTWALLNAGYRVGHCEDACLFTNVPSTIGQFIRQRQRWARGMLEAFRQHPSILLKGRLSTFLIYWNLFYPWLDLAFTFSFIPGLVLALFGHFWIVGPMTLAVMPLALAISLLMFSIERLMFTHVGLRVRRNILGFFIYVFAYSLLVQPASVLGYVDEIFKTRKKWGTK
jgi:biofilm PGA synthesis N-glycosyltransferase PgaC